MIGYFNFTRTGNSTTWIIQQTVINYGIHDRMEADAYFKIDKTDKSSTRFAAPELDLKYVVKEGFLQDKPGDSMAVENSLLLPSTSAQETHVGFQETGIWSHLILGFIFHMNLGVGIERDYDEGFPVLGNHRRASRDKNTPDGRRNLR